MPEAVWKAYIDFEIECAGDDYSKVKTLYNRLLDLT